MNKPSSLQDSLEEQCVANLQRIHKLLKLYSHHSGGVAGFPPNLDGIYLMANDPKPFICPADKQIGASEKTDTVRTSYEIVNDPLKPTLSTTPPNRIGVVAEKRANHNGRRLVLFNDGVVRAFDKAQFDRLKSNSFIDAEVIDNNR